MAKKRPPDRLVVMESGSAFLQHHKVELELISCLERGETPRGLFLLMQPELSLSQPFDSLNFEALVRMRKPNGEIIPASVIIEAAEAHSKTAIIDLWVMRTLLAWLETHREQLSHTQFVGANLSGGQRMRIGIARILLSENIVFADEPTAKLDPQTAELVRKLLIEIADRRLVIVATHDEGLMKVASRRHTLPRQLIGRKAVAA